MTAINNLFAWEQPNWLPTGDDLPDDLGELVERHRAALANYHEAIGAVADTSAQIEASNRAWRRSVRAAVAEGREPPARETPGEVGEAQVQVAQEDALACRRELAEVGIEILDQIRKRLPEFEDYLRRGSVAFQEAIGRGPDGLPVRERVRREAEANEPSIVDLNDPSQAHLAELETGVADAVA